jgi:hypothetical protein
VGRPLRLDSLNRITQPRHLVRQEDLAPTPVQQVHLELLQQPEAVSLVLQNLPPQASEQVHSVLEQEGSAQQLLSAKTTPTPQEDLDVPSPSLLFFLVIVNVCFI